MLFYLTVAIIFFGIDFANKFSSPAANRILNYISLSIFVLIAGTRYETGYDWAAYTLVYENAPTIQDILFENQDWFSFSQMEPMYLLLNILLKTFCNNVTLLFLTSALFNGFVIHKVSQKFKVNSSFVFAVCFCTIYLTGQMTLLRQSLASSFILLALLWLYLGGRVNIYKSYFYLILAAGVQVSSMLFMPFLVALKFKPNLKFTLFVIVLGVLSTIFIDNLIVLFLSSLLAFTTGNIYVKLLEYIQIGSFTSSTASWLYLIINLFILKSIFNVGRIKNWLIEYKIYFYGTFFMVLMLTFLSNQPIFWNRIQLVIVPIQAIYLYKYISSLKHEFNYILSVIIYFICFVILLYSLQKENMIPFIPYQSVIEHIFSNDRGDGAYRLESTIE